MKKILALVIILGVSITYNCLSQATIFPNILFTDNSNRSAMFTVLNEKAEPMEVEISLKFGYTVFDDTAGKKMPKFKDAEAEKISSLIPYTTFYPKKFVLQPKQQQDVKFLLKNTNKLQDGTYWTRIITTSRDVAKQIDSSSVKDSVKLQLKVTFELISSLLFQKGKLNSAVEMTSIETRADKLKFYLLFTCKRSGNSPFFGTAYIEIYDSENRLVEKKNELIPIYYTAKPGFSFDKNIFKAGIYRADITLTNEQPEIPDENKVKFEKTTRSFNFSYDPGIIK